MRPLLAALIALALLPSAALAQDTVYETLSIPTVDGDRIHVEVARPAGGAKVPVILTYSPYNTLSESTSPNLANDDLGQRYVPRGYARAVADVLGTRNSSGCWDYGGRKEQQSGVDLVNALAGEPWASGKVAMIGGSYDGTTANMVAARGVPALKAIVPEAAISRWYGYAYSAGVRYLGNSERPTDEGVDTPLAFDFGLTRTPPTQATPQLQDALEDRVQPCDAAEHTVKGYDSSPDYDQFWRDRDYRRDARRFRAATLIVHGWQDYNVRQSEGIDLYDALPLSTAARPGRPFKRLYLFQAGHASPSDARFRSVLDQFFATTLKGAAPGPHLAAPVYTQGRTAAGPGAFRREGAWPPRASRTRAFVLGDGTLGGAPRRSDASFTDTGASTEEAALRALDAEASWLTYRSAPVTRALRITGTPKLELNLTLGADHGHLTPTLVDIAPDGTAKAISRGFLDLRYRGGLARERAVPPGKAIRARVAFSPQDHTVAAGHRIGVVVAGSNTVWAVPDRPSGQPVTVHQGGRSGSRLLLRVMP